MEEKDKIFEILKKIIDPELGVNIVDLGLVYQVELLSEKTIEVSMTLTSKGCPMGESIINGVGNILKANYADHIVKVTLVWEPRWTPEMISERGLALLG